MSKFKVYKNNYLTPSKSKNMKMFFYLTLMISTMIVINSNSWINAWMGMEINLMSFIPIMMNNMKNKNYSSMMIYFIIQAGASSFLIMSMIMLKLQMNLFKFNLMINMIQLSLLLKLGASPFHWWMPKIIVNLSWMNCFILLTWQKIAPLFLLTLTNFNMLIYLSILFSTMIGAILGMNQNSIKLILTYSSINHLGWMMMNMYLNLNMLMTYFYFYFFINLMICLLLNNLKIYFLHQLFKMNNQDMYIKLITISSFFSLSGLPPFIGFLPKFFTLMIMMNNNLILESILFIIMATISLSYYINPILSMLIITKFNLKWNKKIIQISKMIMSILMMNLLLLMIYYLPLMNMEL
uniref:NADH-ubiquinone oxidoreductase chain 2 n=1 Tax=Taxonus zhangi TaxID=2848090 RepID=A0A8F9SFU6_9HYME|nr:NADH dehydrogenase subunit 2 [Taxonus zhangi]